MLALVHLLIRELLLILFCLVLQISIPCNSTHLRIVVHISKIHISTCLICIYHPIYLSCITYYLRYIFMCVAVVTHKNFKIHVHGRVCLCKQLNLKKRVVFKFKMQYIFIDLSICYIVSK